MSRSPHRDDLPSGHEGFWFEGRLLFALPTQVMRQFSQEKAALHHAKLAELVAAEAAVVVPEPPAAVSQSATSKNPAKRPVYAKAAASGWYRVLPGLQAMVDAGEDAGAALRTPDNDVRQRMTKLRQHLIDRGPDRRVARPSFWRAAINELEVTLPNFAGPIRLLRNTLALAEASKTVVRVPPMLLLGPAGIGKTFFANRVAALMRTTSATVAFDQPSLGSTLRGLDRNYGNTQCGLLFNLICIDGDFANPVVLLDEIDKSVTGSGSRELDPLAQLLGALEPETSRRTVDMSADLIEFDASLVTYIATANSLRRLTLPLLSRMEVFDIALPAPTDAVETARVIVRGLLTRLMLQDKLTFERRCLYVLAHLSPRLMLRTAEKAVGAAMAERRDEVRESDVWAELGGEFDEPRLH